MYYDQGIVMIREQSAAGGMNGKADLWMTGFANFTGGVCTISESGLDCKSRGKVSYLGGHQYSTKTPISANGDSQGTRLFLNSLFEAECVTAQGAANVSVTARAPAYTSSPLVTFMLDWNNVGAGVAVAARMTDTLPAGVSFVSASGGGTLLSGKVVWDLGDLAPGAAGSVSVTVSLPSYGSYSNSAVVTYKVGNNSKTNPSNTTTTIYGAEPPDAGADAGGQPDAGGGMCAGVSCPGPATANPCKVGACNPVDGSCGIVNAADGTPCDDGKVCTVGTTCMAGSCGNGAELQCARPANPCQTATCVAGSGCVVSNLTNGAACSSGDKCVLGEACSNGVCGGGATRACFGSSSPCEVPTCDPATGCGFRPANDGASCEDGDVCTTGTTCASGLCQGGAGCAQPTAPCTISVCGTNGCETMFAAAGTDPRGDCPAIGSCARSCNGAGSCTACQGTGGTGGGAGGAGGTGGSAGGGTGATGGGSAGSTAGGGGTASGSGGAGGGSGGAATGSGGAATGSGGSVTGAGGTGGSVGGTGVGGGPVSGTGGASAGATGGGASSGAGGSAGGTTGHDGGTPDGGGNASAAASGCGCGIEPASRAMTPAQIVFALSLALAFAIRRRATSRRGSARVVRAPRGR
jgi:uncharacterized repeat protein (TIGR01451 family)